MINTTKTTETIQKVKATVKKTYKGLARKIKALGKIKVQMSYPSYLFGCYCVGFAASIMVGKITDKIK